MKLLVSTNNQGKQREIAQILSGLDVELVFPLDVNLDQLEVAETGLTFAENASLKARAFAQQSGLLTVADDSGLEVEALHGAPGVHSKRFAHGSDAEKNLKILAMLEGQTNRRARFRCVLALFDPKTQQENTFVGDFNGQIALRPEGEAGFGFDPIFIPEGETKPISVLGLDYKNEHSHRASAFKQLASYLEKIIGC